MRRLTKPDNIFWLLLLVGAVLRLVGIRYGLPAVFNADEPHVVNVAVSFGAGTLNPHFFKYPTLYMYVLFAAYGVFYVLWSCAGLLHSVRQFSEMFVWHPAPFYLIARGLSALFSLAAAYPVFRAGALLFPRADEKSNTRAGLWPAVFLLFSPIVIISAHAAKPESLLLFLSSGALYFGIRHRAHGKAGDLLRCGFLMGLACSAQYTAIPTLVLIPAAWLVWPFSGIGVLAGAMGAAVFGFLLGCPFAALDYHRLLAMLGDMRAMQGMAGAWNAGWVRQVAWNILTFAGPFWVGGTALVVGAIILLRNDKKSAAVLLIPVVCLAACLSFSGEGGWQRYLFAGFPALALVAGIGAEQLVRASSRILSADFWDRPVALVILAFLLALPGGVASWSFDRELLLPDTRTLAAQWIESHIPQGSKILMDQEHASPPLRLSLETVQRLLERTRASGHPRARYYEIMKESHPGGGYAVYQMLRSAEDLHTMPGHAAESAAGRPVLDVRAGLKAVRKEGIEWIVLTSFGAEPSRSPELARFLQETVRDGKCLMQFSPQQGLLTGPLIRIFKI